MFSNSINIRCWKEWLVFCGAARYSSYHADIIVHMATKKKIKKKKKDEKSGTHYAYAMCAIVERSIVALSKQ